jgi:hypothetical protein
MSKLGDERPKFRVSVGERSHPNRPIYFKQFHTSLEDVNDQDFKEVGTKVLKYHVRHPNKKSNEFFDVMANDESNFIWRPLFAKICGDTLVKKMVEAIRRRVDLFYPEQAPWKCLTWELLPNGKKIDRIFLQINMREGRQPLHFDAGLGWYQDQSGQYWSLLSTITHMNDGVGPFFCQKPFYGVFEKVRQIMENTGNALQAGKHVLTLLQKLEHGVKPTEVMGRAGQIYSFHPGEQVHCGMGYNRCIDPLVPG